MPNFSPVSGRRPFRRRFRAWAGAYGWVTPEEARRVAGTMLPEILSYDPTRPASFPGNGRTLTFGQLTRANPLTPYYFAHDLAATQSL
jgi:hypothetical protein